MRCSFLPSLEGGTSSAECAIRAIRAGSSTLIDGVSGWSKVRPPREGSPRSPRRSVAAREGRKRYSRAVSHLQKLLIMSKREREEREKKERRARRNEPRDARERTFGLVPLCVLRPERVDATRAGSVDGVLLANKGGNCFSAVYHNIVSSVDSLPQPQLRQPAITTF